MKLGARFIGFASDGAEKGVKRPTFIWLIFLTASFTSYNLRFKTVQNTWVSASHFWLMTAILAWVVKDILNFPVGKCCFFLLLLASNGETSFEVDQTWERITPQEEASGRTRLREGTPSAARGLGREKTGEINTWKCDQAVQRESLIFRTLEYNISPVA